WLVIFDRGIGAQAKDFDVQHRHPRLLQSTLGLADKRRVPDHRVLDLLGCGRDQSQADRVEARVARTRHHVGRVELQHRQSGKTDGMLHKRGFTNTPADMLPSAWRSIHGSRAELHETPENGAGQAALSPPAPGTRPRAELAREADAAITSMS